MTRPLLRTASDSRFALRSHAAAAGLTRARRESKVKAFGGSDMMDVTRGLQGEVVIQIGGTFDAKAAARLSRWLLEVSPDDALVLDFTQVRTCEDFGLAAVADDLGARARLVVRGLTRHQERMLRYLGVQLQRSADDVAADGDAVDAVG